MPRITLVCVLLLGACFFQADYGGGDFACSDGRCPAGLVCHADRRCGPPIDAPEPDAMIDAMIDARQEALTCADAGIIDATGGTKMGSTATRSSLMSSQCGGVINNGPDAVFKVTLGAGKTLGVSITGTLKAYVIASCVQSPSTPVCLGTARASSGNPISVNPAAGPSFIVVDEENAGSPGAAYTLTVTVN